VFAAGVGVPRNRPDGIRGVYLRWGHACVWVLLCLAAVASEPMSPVQGVAPILAVAALAVYVVYVATLVAPRR